MASLLVFRIYFSLLLLLLSFHSNIIMMYICNVCPNERATSRLFSISLNRLPFSHTFTAHERFRIKILFFFAVLNLWIENSRIKDWHALSEFPFIKYIYQLSTFSDLIWDYEFVFRSVSMHLKMKKKKNRWLILDIIILAKIATLTIIWGKSTTFPWRTTSIIWTIWKLFINAKNWSNNFLFSHLLFFVWVCVWCCKFRLICSKVFIFRLNIFSFQKLSLSEVSRNIVYHKRGKNFLFLFFSIFFVYQQLNSFSFFFTFFRTSIRLFSIITIYCTLPNFALKMARQKKTTQNYKHFCTWKINWNFHEIESVWAPYFNVNTHCVYPTSSSTGSITIFVMYRNSLSCKRNKQKNKNNS